MTSIGQIIDENSSRTLAPAAVASQVAFMTVISVAAVVTFNILRPKNKAIYEPKVKYHVGDKKPPPISDSLLGWLPPLIRTKEPELLEKFGLDAVTFLRFTRMMRSIFTAVAFICCAILLPVDAVYNLKHVPSSGRDILSMLTIRDVEGSYLFAHVAVTYMISLLVMFFVWRHWKIMLHLREQWFRSPEYMESFYARTLAIMRVPKKYQSDAGIRAIFESVQVPYPTTSVHIGRKVGRLPELIDYHNDIVRQLEQVLVTYLKDGKIAKERPTIRIGGFLGMGGVKKDAIDFYTAKLERVNKAIEDYRQEIDTRRAENYGFASMAAVPYAHTVANMLRKKHPKGTDVTLAPNPKDIIWANMNKSPAELFQKKIIGFSLLVLVCSFNTIPLFIISILANLSSISAYVGFLSAWSTASPGSFAFVSGVLPPSISALFGVALPILMRYLSRFQGALTHSRLDRAVVARYFAFLVISQLVIFTLIGVGFIAAEQVVNEIGEHVSFKDIINNLHSLPATINATYINQSSYWLTFFPLRGFLTVFDLAQVVNLVWVFFKKKVFGRTPRDIREWTQPPEFEYAIYYSTLLFMGTVALVFAPLAPLVALAGAVVFWASSWVYKYQLMFVFVTKVESGGRLWNMVVNRLLVSVILMQLLMALTIGLQYGFKSFLWLTTVPPVLFIIAFKVWINKKFYHQFLYYTPSQEEIQRPHIHSSRADASGNRIERRFGHPALHMELFTPMLHAKMVPLLGEVYKGPIGSDKAKLGEYGGRKLNAQVIDCGIKFAGVEQRDLEYDPALYKRDRGELDWDARSMASAAIFGHRPSESASAYQQKAAFYAAGGESGRSSPAPANYSRTITQSEIELSPLGQSADNLPLLRDREYGYPMGRQTPPPIPTLPPRFASPTPPYAPGDAVHSAEEFREAPLHRPYTHSRPGSSYSTDPPQYNLAGRGTHRPY
ncbi:hypothetical protein BKA82DRAFT_4136393 [Pisolithus tinctorius]|nr:hypothetical protein BKA82DRAFT_4136393 [Pisolithus tinctorius]